MMTKEQALQNILGPVSAPEQLFTQWQAELSARQELRQDTGTLYQLPLENKEYFLFYKRAFFDIGETETFFSILMNHLTQLFWPDILAEQPLELIDAFFAALQQHFSSYTPNTDELKVLIGLFSNDSAAYYPALLSTLKEKDIKFLLDKTSNFTLRSLLLTALENIQPEPSWLTQLFSASPAQKQQLFLQTAHKLEHKLQTFPPEEPLSPEDFEGFFTAGKIEELFQLLSSIWAFASPPPTLEALAPLLGMLIPLYAIIKHPENALTFARQQYKNFFPEEKNLPSGFLYLHLFQLTAQHQTFPNLPFKREFSLRVRQIMKQRPDDILGIWFQTGWPDTAAEALAEQIFQEAKKRLEKSPHETCTLLEILYCLISAEETYYSPQFLGSLLTYAWALYEWLHLPALLPSPKNLSKFTVLADTAIFSQVQDVLLAKS